MSLPDDYFYRVDLIGLDFSGVATTFRYATKAYCTNAGGGASGIAAATFVDGRVTDLSYRRDMYGEAAAFGDAQVAAGKVVIGNQDGGIDALLGYGFDASRVEIWRIDPANVDAEICEFRGVTEQFVMDASEATILLRDYTFALATPLQTKKYLGTNTLPNGLEGVSTDLQGKPKPICIGVVQQIEPVLVNTSRLVYQFHDTAVNTTGFAIAVFDMGAPIPVGANYVSQVDMETNAPAAGTARVWSDATAGTFVRLGATPAGRVTLNVTNPPTVGTSTSEWSRSFQYLLNLKVNWGLDNRITTVGLSEAGFYWKDEISIYDACREVLRTVNGTMQVYGYTNPVFGTVFVTTQRLTVPGSTSTLDIDTTNIKDFQRVVNSDDLRGIPPWRISIGYSRNYTVPTRDELAGGVSDTLVQFFTNEYRYVRQDNAITLQKFPRAQQLTIETNLTGDPTTELAAYYLGLLVAPADVFQVTIPMALADSLLDNTSFRNVYGMELGRVVKLTYPRFYLASGFFGMVIGYISDYVKREIDLFLWVKQ